MSYKGITFGCGPKENGSLPFVRTKVYVRYVILENYYLRTALNIKVKFCKSRKEAQKIIDKDLFSRYIDRISLDELNKLIGSRK